MLFKLKYLNDNIYSFYIKNLAIMLYIKFKYVGEVLIRYNLILTRHFELLKLILVYYAILIP